MSDTKVPFPNPTLNAGQRLVVSGYARAQVADYGDKRAAERDAFWQREAASAAPTQGAEGAAPQAVVGEAKPFGWYGESRFDNDFTTNEDTSRRWHANGYRLTPLYIAPSPTPTAPQGLHCLTCSDQGAVGLADRSEPCPDCTPPGSLAQAPQEADALREALTEQELRTLQMMHVRENARRLAAADEYREQGPEFAELAEAQIALAEKHRDRADVFRSAALAQHQPTTLRETK